MYTEDKHNGLHIKIVPLCYLVISDSKSESQIQHSPGYSNKTMSGTDEIEVNQIKKSNKNMTVDILSQFPALYCVLGLH